MQFELVDWASALKVGGNTAFVAFNVLPTACVPTISIDTAAALANIPNFVNDNKLKMYMMSEWGAVAAKELASTFQYYVQTPNCMYDWKFDLVQKTNFDPLNPN